MPKKSRIIVNNWTSLSDEMCLFYAHFAFNSDEVSSRQIKTNDDGVLYVGVFHNKSSVSLDVREVSVTEEQDSL